jgi:hypothetical protein
MSGYLYSICGLGGKSKLVQLQAETFQLAAEFIGGITNLL